MNQRNYGPSMNSKYKRLLAHWNELGEMLKNEEFASFESQTISFNYLSYFFESRHHAVIFQGSLALKVRFETQVFSDQVAHFDIVVNEYSQIIPLGEKNAICEINNSPSADIVFHFNRIVGSFLESSEFYHEK
ncbi:hypothetical protein ACTHEF_002177 [Vibrio parahaemolyticus]|uniref:hypothetical protein n=1 Tax=Vibrio sp. HS-50-1 TaxID=2945079 RepID=UPI00215EC11B|nr:hypothetical protein [Vibrio sp. HS-50-1]MCS0205239.1 hypothetical protein [Vibrio sp. HS-50-1]